MMRYFINFFFQDGDPKKTISVPSGYTYEMYTRDDVERLLGDKAKCISQRSAACRCFGFLVSKKKYIYTVDDDCFVSSEIVFVVYLVSH